MAKVKTLKHGDIVLYNNIEYTVLSFHSRNETEDMYIITRRTMDSNSVITVPQSELKLVVTRKSRISKLRNFQKMRLMGISITEEGLSTAEIAMWREIKRRVDVMLENWDDQSILLGFKVLPYKCHHCGHRTSVKHEYQGENYCKKHFEEFTKTTE